MLLRNAIVCLFLLALLAAMSRPAEAADWPQFRGPGGRAQSDATGLPTTWSDEENIVWKTALPGPGASSPVTFGGRIFLTCYSGYGLDEKDPGDVTQLQRHLLCLDRDGKILWKKTFEPSQRELPYQGFTALHGYASSTPLANVTIINVGETVGHQFLDKKLALSGTLGYSAVRVTTTSGQLMGGLQASYSLGDRGRIALSLTVSQFDDSDPETDALYRETVGRLQYSHAF